LRVVRTDEEDGKNVVKSNKDNIPTVREEQAQDRGVSMAITIQESSTIPDSKQHDEYANHKTESKDFENQPVFARGSGEGSELQDRGSTTVSTHETEPASTNEGKKRDHNKN
jgi:hypothetical protein